MSTTNTETLVLYKNAKLYNGSRYKVFQGGTGFNYDTWLSNNSAGSLTKTVYYKSITEPILILEDLPTMDAYTYGSLTAMGKKYYIFVDRVTTDQNGRTSISYSVDWWATEWANVSIVKAHVIRQNIHKPGYLEQPISTKNMTITQTPLTNDFCFMATYIPSINEHLPSFISCIILEGSEENAALIEQGYWYQELNIAGSDIKDSFVVPFYTYNDFVTTESIPAIYFEGDLIDFIEPEKIWEDFAETFDLGANPFNIFTKDFITRYGTIIEWTNSRVAWKIVIFESKRGLYIELGYDSSLSDEYYGSILGDFKPSQNITQYITKVKYDYLQQQPVFILKASFKMLNMDTGVIRHFTKALTPKFTSTEKDRQGIADWNGNLIWECPIGISEASFNTRLLIGVSHIMIEFVPALTDDNISMLNGLSFCYDCRHPGLFVDSYQEYILKNREYDIQMRQIQSDKQLYSSVASTAENAGFGMAFGQGVGMGAATMGGVIETVGTYIINEIFDPKIQSAYDLRYSKITDQISIVGDSITNMYNVIHSNNGALKKYTMSVSTSSADRYDDDISINGYYSDEMVENLSVLCNSGIIIQADNAIIEGAVPLDCKHQIVYRLQNGVEFI